MTKADVITQVSDTTGKDQKDIAPIVEAFINVINKSMKEHKPIFIRGFGTFNIVKKKEKKGRNITKGTELIIPAHFAPTFTFCEKVKNTVKQV